MAGPGDHLFMQRLILMRHSKTEPWTERTDDFGRALLARGHEDARQMAAALAREGWLPDLILISPSRRTRETAAHVCAVFDHERVRAIEGLYLAGLPEIEAALAKADGQTVMMIGHNPGLHDYALTLAERGGTSDDAGRLRLYEKFPTSCVALFERPGADSLTPFRLVAVMRVADLRSERD